MARVLVTGSRNPRDMKLIDSILSKLHAVWNFTMLMHGGANGVDKLAGQWADARDIPVLIFPADWDDIYHPKAKIAFHAGGQKYDKLAGFRRNQQMLDEGCPDLVIVFPGENGTRDMYIRAKKADRLIILVSHDGRWSYDHDSSNSEFDQ